MNYYPYMSFNTHEFPSPYPTNQEEAERPWMEWEDQRLKMASDKFLGKGWRKISMVAFPDGSRTKEACLKRWKLITKTVSVKGLWTAEEDSKLTSLVKELGAEKWVAIASHLSTRTGKQCRERWHNHLDPRINKSPFTPEEEKKIFELHEKIGNKWAEMAKVLPGRSDNSIKNFYNTAMQRRRKLTSTDDNNNKESNHPHREFTWPTNNKEKPFVPFHFPMTMPHHPLQDQFMPFKGLSTPETSQQGLALDISLDLDLYSQPWSYPTNTTTHPNTTYPSPHLPAPSTTFDQSTSPNSTSTLLTPHQSHLYTPDFNNPTNTTAFNSPYLLPPSHSHHLSQSTKDHNQFEPQDSTSYQYNMLDYDTLHHHQDYMYIN